MTPMEQDIIHAGINAATRECHAAAVAAGWHAQPMHKGVRIALIHSEISEALEGERTDAMDEKLPHRRAAEVELADALIRIFDYAGEHGYDLGGAVVEKLAFNATRADHKPEARAASGGKKF